LDCGWVEVLADGADQRRIKVTAPTVRKFKPHHGRYLEMCLDEAMLRAQRLVKVTAANLERSRKLAKELRRIQAAIKQARVGKTNA
jgi:hypothetical protein